MIWLTLVSCASQPTEIVLGLASTRPFPCMVDSYALEVVEPLGTRTLVPIRPWTSTPIQATLIPDSGMSTTVRLVAYLAGAEVGAAEATLAFHEGESLYYPLIVSDDDGCFPGPCQLAGERGLVFMDELPEDQATPMCDECETAVELCNGVSDDCDTRIDEDADCGDETLFCSGGACLPRVSGYAVSEASVLESFVDSCTWPDRSDTFFTSSDSDSEEQLPLPPNFDFEFLGEPVSFIWIGENGYITFGEEAPLDTFLRDPARPDTCQAIRPAVYPFWDGLATRSAGVCAGVSGVMGHRRLEITWSDVCFTSSESECDPSTSLSFSVVLEEGSHKIYFLYGDMEGGGRAMGLNAAIGLSAYGPGVCDTCMDHDRCLLSNTISFETVNEELLDRVLTPVRAD